MSNQTIISSSCPICGKERHYKTKNGYRVGLKKPCKSCSHSISRGGTGTKYDINGNRQCKGCGDFLPLEAYYVKEGSKLGTSLCKTCSNKTSKEYNKSIYRYKKYGITQELFNQTLKSQNNCCAICNKPFETLNDIRIDHNHKSFKFRGLLCHHCNVAIGHLNDNIQILKQAIKYLKNGH